MGREARRTISEPETIRVLAHPVRLELLTYLMANGPATASVCARAVGDTPSNCSYHLRALAKVGMVAPDTSTDARERPWKALVTGYEVERHDEDPTSPAARQAMALAALTLQRDQRLLREYLARRERVPRRWRDVDGYSTYVLRVNPDELRELGERLDAMIRPYIAATRDDAPPDAEQVHVALSAFPLQAQP
jgi:DNA-binding transcriptional ArsR family regulator